MCNYYDIDRNSFSVSTNGRGRGSRGRNWRCRRRGTICQRWRDLGAGRTNAASAVVPARHRSGGRAPHPPPFRRSAPHSPVITYYKMCNYYEIDRNSFSVSTNGRGRGGRGRGRRGRSWRRRLGGTIGQRWRDLGAGRTNAASAAAPARHRSGGRAPPHRRPRPNPPVMSHCVIIMTLTGIHLDINPKKRKLRRRRHHKTKLKWSPASI